MTWLSFGTIFAMIISAMWTTSRTGDPVIMSGLFTSLMILLPATMGAIGGWFGVSNAVVHKYQAENGAEQHGEIQDSN
jgi:hypothetical protein